MKKGKRTPPPLAYRAEEALRKAVVSGIGEGTKTGIGGSFVNQDRA